MTLSEENVETLSGNKTTEKLDQINKEERRFSDSFYGPITEKLLKDPVVIPDGDSYERQEILSRGNVSQKNIYTNRALASIIEERVRLNESSIRSNMRSIRNNLEQILEKSVIPSVAYRPLNENFYCPITFVLMHEPVIDPEGNTFERSAIISWIRANNNSPITRSALEEGDLYPNNAITDLLDIEKGREENSIHPSIRRWKDEAPPSIRDLEEGEGESFPTTREEIERRRAEQMRYSWTLLGIFWTICLAVIITHFFGVVPIFVLFILFYNIASCGLRIARVNRELSS